MKHYVKILSISILVISLFKPMPVHAITVTMTTKERLNYEILDVTISASSITVTGWAFLNNNQHFRSSADHSVYIEFVGMSDSFVVSTSLTNISMTSTYQQMGMSFCPEKNYNSQTCNYYYDNVGFQAVIPTILFKQGEKYSTNLIVYANSSSTYLKTPLYYPMEIPIQLKIGDYQYSIVSILMDTSFRIIESPIYARNGPSKTATIWASGVNCSTSYKNKLYFKQNSIYTMILERYRADYQTYYRVKAKLDVCIDSRRRIIEGATFSPVWISGIFVAYSGSPMMISSILINTNPVISAQDQEVNVKDHVNLLDYAKSYDQEEGDLTYKTIILSSNYQDLAGIYQITYYVEDKYGYSATKTINITVIGLNNDPPVINASDKTVTQYSSFDYFDQVTSFDSEDGDITSLIKIQNQINTNVLGNQDLCYVVIDSNEAQTVKCIIVNVISTIALTNQFRFISKINPFYQESIPDLWIEHFNQLKVLLNEVIVKETRIINP